MTDRKKMPNIKVIDNLVETIFCLKHFLKPRIPNLQVTTKKPKLRVHLTCFDGWGRYISKYFLEVTP